MRKVQGLPRAPPRPDVSALDDLITELARLPGIGRKTAQRLTFHLLQQPRERMIPARGTLRAVAERVHPCLSAAT